MLLAFSLKANFSLKPRVIGTRKIRDQLDMVLEVKQEASKISSSSRHDQQYGKSIQGRWFCSDINGKLFQHWEL